MNDENNVIKISKHIEMKSLVNAKSYWQSVHNSSWVDIDFSRSIKFRKNEIINLFNKSFGISLREFSVEFGRVGLCAMAQLEQERFILRIPATDLYLKTRLSKEIIGNFRCLPKTVSSLGYAILPKIEADLICKYIFDEKNPDLLTEFDIKELPTDLGTSPLDLFQDIDDSEISVEGAILRHIENNGFISRQNICLSAKQEALLEALAKLEDDGKLIRLIGTDYYVRLIPKTYYPTNLDFEIFSNSVNEIGFKEILKMESENFIKTLCIIMKSYPNTRDKISRNVKAAMEQRELIL